MTISQELAATCIALAIHGKPETTRKTIRNDLCRMADFLGDDSPEELVARMTDSGDPETFRVYAERFRDERFILGESVQRINGRVCALNRVAKAAHALGLLDDKAHVSYVSRKMKSDRVSPKVVERVFDVSRRNADFPAETILEIRNRAILALCATEGLYAKSLSAMKTSDAGFGASLRFRIRVKKGYVDLSDSSTRALTDWIEQRGELEVPPTETAMFVALDCVGPAYRGLARKGVECARNNRAEHIGADPKKIMYRRRIAIRMNMLKEWREKNGESK